MALAAALALGSPAAASAAQASAVVSPTSGGSSTIEIKPQVGKSASGAPSLGQFSARALEPDGHVSPKSYFTLDLPAGGDYSGEIQVTNAAKKSTRLRVYSVDGLTGETTGTVYANRDDKRAETSLWITPARELIHVDGAASRTLAFKVHVPDDATPGDHVGAIAMEAAAVPKTQGQFAVNQIIRVAVAIQIRVRGQAAAKLELGAQKLEKLGGTQVPSVTTQLANVGQLLCRPMLSIALSKEGEPLGTAQRQLDTILAGDTIQYPMPWPKPLDAGTYEATTTSTGCGPAATETNTLVLKSALVGTVTNPGTSFDPKSGGGIPWWVLALSVAVALLGGFFLARRKPKRDEEPTAGQPSAA